jgi:thymidylate synthase
MMNEQGYLDLMKKVVYEGHRTKDRTGTGNRFLSGMSVKYDISNYRLPLFTTRKVPWKNVVEELLFFLRGDTDTKKLEAKQVFIWKQNSSEEFIKSRNLPYREGVIGPMYGFQHRHFGAEYKGPDVDYTGQGYDQIRALFGSLKNDPYSRRHMLTAWNPQALDQSVLPPCHFAAQWVVHDDNDDESYGPSLDCILYQRSCDLPLGCPTNVASYSLLTFILCHYCGMQPGVLTHFIGHAHVYENQVPCVLDHVKRVPTFPPKLEMVNMPASFETLETENFMVKDYDPQPFIRYPFST